MIRILPQPLCDNNGAWIWQLLSVYQTARAAEYLPFNPWNVINPFHYPVFEDFASGPLSADKQ